ncbi:unnamed protein product [Caretta caretta]
MAEYIVSQLVEKLKMAKSFALQLDESKDISGEVQLIAYIRYPETTDINEHILFCECIKGYSTREDILKPVDFFFPEHYLNWNSCKFICTDWAAAMTRRVNELVARIRKENPSLQWVHCIILREAFASKKMSSELHEILNESVKTGNFIKSRPLNAHLFRILCKETGSEHPQLLLHTEICWLSRGKVLSRLFELRTEVHMFLSDQSSPLASVLDNIVWLAQFT